MMKSDFAVGTAASGTNTEPLSQGSRGPAESTGINAAGRHGASADAASSGTASTAILASKQQQDTTSLRKEKESVTDATNSGQHQGSSSTSTPGVFHVQGTVQRGFVDAHSLDPSNATEEDQEFLLDIVAARTSGNTAELQKLAKDTKIATSHTQDTYTSSHSVAGNDMNATSSQPPMTQQVTLAESNILKVVHMRQQMHQSNQDEDPSTPGAHHAAAPTQTTTTPSIAKTETNCKTNETLDITIGSQPELEVDDPQTHNVPPVSLAREQRQRPQPPPGAFAQPGLMANYDDDDVEQQQQQQQESSPHPQQQNNNSATDSSALSNAGLAVANLVPEYEQSHHFLPQAEDMALSRSSHHKAMERVEETKRFKRWVWLGVVVVLVAVIVTVIAIVVPRNSKSPTTEMATEFTTEATANSTSSSPSPAPTSMEDSFLSMLPEHSASTITSDPESPQAQAFQWLLEDILDHHPSTTKEQLTQRFALATLYFSTNGDKWTHKDSWLSHDEHECDWGSINSDFAMKAVFEQQYPGFLSEFFPPSEPTPTTCNHDGLYQNLWLDNNNLMGSLPEELYLLTWLQTLSLGFNTLSGSISSQIGQLTTLEGFTLFAQPISGAIPSEIGLLTGLRGLVISGPTTHYRGSSNIPSEIWQLTNLQTLIFMSQPHLQGRIPTEIGTFSKLRWLVMDDCDLSGTIPSELGQIETLEWIVSESNRHTGTLPTELANPPKVSMISLLGNSFTGTIPSELGLATSLIFLLALRDNQLTGPVPSELGLLSDLSVTLNLRNNQLTGTIPTELGVFTSLVELELLNNQLTGPIPSEFGQLTVLGKLSLEKNDLSGTLPQELSALQQPLHTLQLEDNPKLSGVVPEALCSTNGTCIPTGLDPCEGDYGTSFDCTSLLCGCDCACQ